IEGAALSSLLAMFFYNLIKYLYVKKRLNFDPFSWDVAKTIIAGILVLGLDYFLVPTFSPVILDIAVRLSVLFASYAAFIRLMGIAPDSQKMVLDKWKHLTRKKPK